MSQVQRFEAVYQLAGSRKQALERAKDICLEQTVELPDALVPQTFIRQNVLGQVKSLRRVKGAHEAVIAFPAKTAAGELTQFLNVVFGNISLKPGIRLCGLKLNGEILKTFRGPRFGVAGLRKFLGIPKRPILCSALKPMGLSPKALADLAYEFALGGIDLIKDDHGLTNQPYARFQERVKLCAQAVNKANRKTGFRCLYVANVTAPADEIKKRTFLAKNAGAGGLMIAPGLTGYDAMRLLADDARLALPIIAHPAFQGSYVLNPQSGISHGVIFGVMARLAGADASIFPNFGGRFSFSQEECRELVDGCRTPMGNMKPIFPCPGGGMGLERVPEMIRFYGHQVIFLIGGALVQGDLIKNCQKFRALAEKDK
jgi:ribulose-bisphosphate carboxylase large chain